MTDQRNKTADRSSLFLLLGLAALLCGGCGPIEPDVTAAGGVVTINGNPINNVEVRFVPVDQALDGNYIARGVTDEEGKFTLHFPGKTDSGVVIGTHKVMVLEGPVPEGGRGQSEEAQMEALKFEKSLKNRPIPKIYMSLSQTPISVVVTEGKSDYSIELERGRQTP